MSKVAQTRQAEERRLRLNVSTCSGQSMDAGHELHDYCMPPHQAPTLRGKNMARGQAIVPDV